MYFLLLERGSKIGKQWIKSFLVLLNLFSFLLPPSLPPAMNNFNPPTKTQIPTATEPNCKNREKLKIILASVLHVCETEVQLLAFFEGSLCPRSVRAYRCLTSKHCWPVRHELLLCAVYLRLCRRRERSPNPLLWTQWKCWEWPAQV